MLVIFVFMSNKNLPNLLTIIRIILIPVMIISFFIPWKITNLMVALLFALASITDYFDGYYARLFKVSSDFGRCFDPIADKLLVATALLLLVQFNNSIWLLIPSIIIICREILVSGLREFLAGIKITLRVSKLAKWKTGMQMTAITCLLISSKNAEYTYEVIMNLFNFEKSIRIGLYGLIENIGLVLLNIASILTVITGYSYLKIGLKNMDDK